MTALPLLEQPPISLALARSLRRTRERERRRGRKKKKMKNIRAQLTPLCSFLVAFGTSLQIDVFFFFQKCRLRGRSSSSSRRTSRAPASTHSTVPTDTAPGAALRSPRWKSSGELLQLLLWRLSSSL